MLWADDALVLALKERAPDFFDWISHVVSCPIEEADRVPGFAVAGLRSAAEYPGVVWHGGDLDLALAAAFPGEPVMRAPARSTYAELVQAATQAGEGWLVWTGAADARDVVRVRWAMAERGRRGRTILEQPACAAPGWWPVEAACMDVHQAAARLQGRAGERAALAAMLLDLEPGAIALAERSPGALEDMIPLLREAGDPGAALAREMWARGGLDVDEVVRWRARGLPVSQPEPEAWVGAPILRALYSEPAVSAYCEQVRARTEKWLAAFARGAQPAPEEAPGDEEMLLWAENCPPDPPSLPDTWPSRVPMTYWVEAVLRVAAAHDWLDVARWALDLGHAALELHDLAQTLERQGRYREAVATYREALGMWGQVYQTHEHADVAMGLQGLGTTLASLGRHREAEQALRESRAIARKHSPGQD